jgi:hypothetical protein
VPAGVRVGTVDKFQGQEAPVVLVSLAGSSAEGRHRTRPRPLDPARHDDPRRTRRRLYRIADNFLAFCQ